MQAGLITFLHPAPISGPGQFGWVTTSRRLESALLTTRDFRCLSRLLKYGSSEPAAESAAGVFTYGTRGGGKGAQQLQTVLHGLHMNVLNVHAEAVITDDDLDDNWQLTDPNSTPKPTLNRLHEIDTAFSETLLDSQ